MFNSPIKTACKIASLALAGSLLAAGIATAAPAGAADKFSGFTDEVDTAPRMQSRRQPITHTRGGPKAFEVFEEQVDRDAPMQSRGQRISHKLGNPSVSEDQVDLIVPPPMMMMRWR